MITKNKSKNTYYIERETDSSVVMERVLLQLVKELRPMIDENINLLNSKDAGEYRTLEISCSIGNTEMSRLIRFYKSAVVNGYYRQHYGNWDRKPKAEELRQVDAELKRLVGFVERDIQGNKTDIPNSITTFKLVKEFLQFLTDVENVCFEDNGYLFPDAKEYKNTEKKKGRSVAQSEWLDKLKEHIKNKFPNREIV